MTLNQLRYAVTAAESGSVTEAAGKLFLSQPSLTSALHELEKELGITIFLRSGRGITTTTEGDEFLGYARQLLEQENMIREKYMGGLHGKYSFCVSTQHYSFAVEAFVELLKGYSEAEYEFHIRETQTYSIIEDVARLRSEVGVLYLNPFNEAVLSRTIAEHDLTFEPLFTARPHVFLSRENPLAKKASLTLEDLEPYPRLSYEQGEHNSFYYFEEIQSTLPRKKDIVVTDRATLFNLVIGLNGYTICSGVINSKLNGESIIALPLEVEDYMRIGYLTHRHIHLGKLAGQYIEALKKYAQSTQQSVEISGC